MFDAGDWIDRLMKAGGGSRSTGLRCTRWSRSPLNAWPSGTRSGLLLLLTELGGKPLKPSSAAGSPMLDRYRLSIQMPSVRENPEVVP